MSRSLNGGSTINVTTGTGTPITDGMSDNTLQLRGITAGTGMTVTGSAGNITLSSSGGYTSGTFTPTLAVGGDPTGITYTSQYTMCASVPLFIYQSALR